MAVAWAVPALQPPFRGGQTHAERLRTGKTLHAMLLDREKIGSHATGEKSIRWIRTHISKESKTKSRYSISLKHSMHAKNRQLVAKGWAIAIAVPSRWWQQCRLPFCPAVARKLPRGCHVKTAGPGPFWRSEHSKSGFISQVGLGWPAQTKLIPAALSCFHYCVRKSCQWTKCRLRPKRICAFDWALAGE